MAAPVRGSVVGKPAILANYRIIDRKYTGRPGHGEEYSEIEASFLPISKFKLTHS
jgi:hypothetical protein